MSNILGNDPKSERTLFLEEKDKRATQLKKWIVCCSAVRGVRCAALSEKGCPYEHEAEELIKGTSLPCQNGETCVYECYKRSWKKDDTVGRCEACAAGFSIVARKSHCRRCGGIFCSASAKECLSELQPIGKVCTKCRTILRIGKKSSEGCPWGCVVQ